MKIQIRHGVFETNSSSTHSMTICDKKDYDKWVEGVESHLYLKEGTAAEDSKFLSEEEVKSEMLEDERAFNLDELLKEKEWHDSIEDMLASSGYYKYEDYGWAGYYTQHVYSEEYEVGEDTTIKIFGLYGYNG